MKKFKGFEHTHVEVWSRENVQIICYHYSIIDEGINFNCDLHGMGVHLSKKLYDIHHKSEVRPKGYIIISSIRVFPENIRSKGVGRNALMKFCDEYPEHIILLNTGLLDLEYGNKYDRGIISKNEAQSIIARINSFYENYTTFKAISQSLRNPTRTYIYINDLGEKFYKIIIDSDI